MLDPFLVPGISQGASDWGDFDNDGDLDLIIVGKSKGRTIADIYRNDSNNSAVFTRIDANLMAGVRSAVAWGDYDNDGYLDVLISGGETEFTRLYKNEDRTRFPDVTGAALKTIRQDSEAVDLGSIDWGDYDNDGDLDILLTGENGKLGRTPSSIIRYTRIYKNTDGIFESVDIGSSISNGEAIWGDYDNDGDLDILLAGQNSDPSFISRIYINKNGMFDDSLSLDIDTSFALASLAWGDYDNDGDLDILISAGRDSTLVEPAKALMRIYKNNNGTFVDIGAQLPEIYGGDVAWGDYDNDGDLDILMTGTIGSDSSNFSAVYKNNASEGSSDSLFTVGQKLTGLTVGSTNWVDYDNDGDLDAFITGDEGGNTQTPTTQLYRNESTVANTLPVRPDSMGAVYEHDDTIVFSWSPGADNETPEKALTYNLFVFALDDLNLTPAPLPDSILFSMPGSTQILQPMALKDGRRQVVRIGNAGYRLSKSLKLPDADYYWGVQTIDGAFAGSPFARSVHCAMQFKLDAYSSGQSIRLKWNAPCNRADSIEVYRSTQETNVLESLIATLGATDTLYVDTDVKAGEYFYRLIARHPDYEDLNLLSDVASAIVGRSAPGGRIVMERLQIKPKKPTSSDPVKVIADFQGPPDMLSQIKDVYLDWKTQLNGQVLDSVRATMQMEGPASYSAFIRKEPYLAAVSYEVSALDATDSVLVDTTGSYEVRNSPPIALKPFLFDTLAVGESRKYDLNEIFYDEDNDALFFSPGSIENSVLRAEILRDSLHVEALQKDSTSFAILADDSLSEDSANAVFNITVTDFCPLSGFLNVNTIDAGAILKTPFTGVFTIKDSANPGISLLSDNIAFDRIVMNARKGGELNENFVELELGQDSTAANRYVADFPAALVTDRGIEFYVEANLAAQNPGSSPCKSQSRLMSISVEVPPPGVANTTSLLDNKWNLVSVPLALTDRSPNTVIGDDFGVYDRKKWQFFGSIQPENMPRSTTEFPELDAIQVGRGYWLVLACGDSGASACGPGSIDSGAGSSIHTAEPFPVDMGFAGWHLIGNPFTFNIPVGNITQNGLPTPICSFSYENSASGNWEILDDSDLIEPFKGYAAYSRSDEPIWIDPVVESINASVQDVGRETPLWQIDVIAESNGITAKKNLAAVYAGASEDWDVFDRPESPVSPGTFVSVSFSNPESESSSDRYRIDARPEPASGVSWEVNVTSNTRYPVNLQFNGIEQIPADHEVWLVDPVLDAAQNLRINSSYVLGAMSGMTPGILRLIVGKADYLQEHKPPESPIEQFGLLPNFPNPFNPSTTIPFNLEEAGPVTLEIYDALGRRVATLIRGEEKPNGRHAAVWDGRNDAGQTVSSGLYFIRFQAGQTIQTRTTMMVK